MTKPFLGVTIGAVAVAAVTAHSTIGATLQIDGMTMEGCVRAERVNPTNPTDTRIVYVLETKAAASAEGNQPPQKTQLAVEDARALQKHVGQRVQITGELLMPPGIRPERTEGTPLPGDAEGAFRVKAVKVLSKDCR
jgi:hypothetical protein